MNQLNLSARAYHRILKLARSIADLAQALHASQSPEVDDGMNWLTTNRLRAE